MRVREGNDEGNRVEEGERVRKRDGRRRRGKE